LSGSLKSMWMSSLISINFTAEILPVGANEFKADRRFFPDFYNTTANSRLHSVSSGSAYSPTKARMIDLAMVRSTSFYSW
jgi:hypothetical protein